MEKSVLKFWRPGLFFTTVFSILSFFVWPQQVIAATIDCADVVALYNFNGNADDRSGNGNKGVLVNGADCLSTGKFGGGCLFDGADDYINLGSDASLDTLKSFTFSLWIRQTGGDPYKALISKDPDSIWPWSVYISDNALHSYLFHNTTAARADSTYQFNNDWTHIGVTYDINGDRRIHLYINGNETGYYPAPAVSQGAMTPNDAANMTLGGVLAQHNFKGSMDDLVIYKKALPAQEIKNLYDGSTQSVCNTCQPINCSALGKVCGDNGCGGSCGTCGAGKACNSSGTACEAAVECNDGMDNDGDGEIDAADVGCKDGYDDSELIPGELIVNNVQRLTPKEYSIANNFFSHRPVFNADDAKLLIYETSSSDNIHPIYGQPGRANCWGEIKNLKAWKTFAEYKQACHPLPDNNKLSQWSSTMYWSVFPEEKDVIYASFQDGWLKKFDTSNESAGWVNHVNLVPVGATAAEIELKDGIRCFGWDGKKQLICNLDDENWGTKFGAAQIVGWAVDVKSKTAHPVSNWFTGDGKSYDCTPQGARYGTMQYNGMNVFSHGHGDNRGNYEIAYGQGYLWRLSDCTKFIDPNRRAPFTSHVDWDVSPDWFIGDGYSANYNTTTYPILGDNAIVQSFINLSTESFGERIDLYLQSSAQAWTKNYSTLCNADSDCGYDQKCNTATGKCYKSVSNYHAGLLPKMNNGGTALVYTATGGKYSVSDYQEYGINNGWTGSEVDTLGLYLMEFGPGNNIFAPADVNSDGSINIRDIQICIKAIVDPGLFNPDHLDQLAKCKAVALPDTVVNIKDIQTIVREIIK